MNRSDEYEGFKNEYPRGRISFKSSLEGLDDLADQYSRAIRFRINGGTHLSGSSKGPGRVGAKWINRYMVNKIKEVVKRIDEQTEDPLEIKDYYVYAQGKRTKTVAVLGKERTCVFIVRNWINRLHNSQLPRINESLDKTEEILKARGYKKISKVAFTGPLENQKTLDIRKDIYYYELEYIQPEGLNEIVKEQTGIDLNPYYPAPTELNFGLEALLFAFLYKLVTPRLFKKQDVQKKRRMQQQSSLKTMEKETVPFLISNVESSSSRERGMKQAYSVYEPINEYLLTDNLLHIPEKEDLEAQISGLGPPSEPLSVRFTHQKKRSSRRVHMLRRGPTKPRKTKPKLGFHPYPRRKRDPTHTQGPYFYRNVVINDKPKKLRLGNDSLEIAKRRRISEKEALIQCIFALRNYHTTNIFIKSKVRDVLTRYITHLNMLR